MLLRSEGAKARVDRAEQAQAIAHDTRREWGAVEKFLHTKKNEVTGDVLSGEFENLTKCEHSI